MKIAVVKYNAGNIYSVNYALKRLGVETTCTRYLPGNAADVPALRRRKCRLLGHL